MGVAARRLIFAISIAIAVFLAGAASAGSPSEAGPANSQPGNRVLISEDFSNLDNWAPFRLFKGKKNTLYTCAVEDGQKCLKAESDCSVSALALNREFNVYEFPVVSWKWKVDNVYKNGDIEKKSLNDAPARLYILFKYNPEKAGFFTKLKYSIAKRIYGMYPPQSSLCYVWANRPYKRKVITSPVWSRSKSIVLEAGDAHLGQWRQEQVNIVEDYRAAFGKNPPRMAVLAIMDNSQHTCEKSVSYFGSLEISGQGPAGDPSTAGRPD
ncbi:MAG: DUF3047 domain-containing protein [Nitrospiraceae bacterium]|nr:DUF3047 domain-containing protein [Nitrospiraceae bacterium]